MTAFPLICEVTDLKQPTTSNNSWKSVRVIFMEKCNGHYKLATKHYTKMNVNEEKYGIVYNIIYEPCNKFIKRIGGDDFPYEYFMVDGETKVISEVDKEVVETFREL